MRKSNEKNQGITLIALIVTIIVLLILAGITLSLVAGSDGILARATNAVDKHEIATIKENVELKIAEDIEKFHEEKYVDFSIDNTMTAYEYLKENTSKTIQKGDEEYTIEYIDSTDPSNPNDNKIQVNYVKKGTKLSITGKISQTGVITWDEDIEIGGGNDDGSGDNTGGDMGDTGGEKDIPLSISDPTWNGTNATVTVNGKKEGSQLQYKVGDTGEWINVENGASVTVPAGTTIEVCLFDGTNREVISSPKTLTLSYTVAYDGNGATSGSTESSSHEYGIAKGLNSNGFTKDGFTFKGWNTVIDGTGQAYADGESVTNLSSVNGETVTLFAQWEEEKSATESISKTNYGDLVNYSANGVDDWKIFLNDGKNIYIITAGYVPNSLLSLPTNIYKKNTYIVYGDRKTYGSYKSSFYPWFHNGANWSKFAEGIEGATATGGPTLAQFLQSYNASYGTSYLPANIGPYDKTEYPFNELYAPYGKNTTGGATGYWLDSLAQYRKSIWSVD